jgi:hypothetical protein
MNRIIYGLAFFLVSAWGCEHIAIMPRNDITEELSRRGGETDRTPPERVTRSEDVRESTVPHGEITGTVQRIDKNRREVHLRTTEDRMVTVRYDQATAVFDREREIRIESLNQGDLVTVRVNSNSRGEQYADVIRLSEQQDRYW